MRSLLTFALTRCVLSFDSAMAQEATEITTFGEGEHEITSPLVVISMQRGADVTVKEGADVFVGTVSNGTLTMESGSIDILQIYNASTANFLGGETRLVDFNDQSSGQIRGGTFQQFGVMGSGTVDFFGGEVASPVTVSGDGGTLNIRGPGISSVSVRSDSTLNLLAGSIDGLFVGKGSRVNVVGGSLNSLTLGGDSVVNLYGDNLQSVTTQALEGIVANTEITGTLANGTELTVTTTLVNDYEVNFLPSACGATFAGDFTGDGITDFSDFLLFSENFGNETTDPLTGDADCDGLVGFTDFLVVSANFQGQVGQLDENRVTAVPEPASCGFVPLLICISLVLRRRSRDRVIPVN